MITHILMTGVQLEKVLIHPSYVGYLGEWRENAIKRADQGDVSASICLQATMIDLVLGGKPDHDWIGVMDEFLTYQGVPIAYSEVFSRRVHGFSEQYKQSTIHAIHTRWWIEQANGKQLDHQRFAYLLQKKKQTDGLFYDRDVSETILRHRMKLELTMSMTMVVEILRVANLLDDAMSISLATDLCSPMKCPQLGYISMEYFRLMALEMLKYRVMFPAGIDRHLENCASGLDVGWCDFSMAGKVDAHMGTAHRTGRDRPIHSPLVGCQVEKLFSAVSDAQKIAALSLRMEAYSKHLSMNPSDIPAFQMRDVPIPFGSDRTPIETICASELIARCPKE